MAELLGIVALTALFGYLNSKGDENPEVLKDVPKELLSNGNSIYTSNRVDEVTKEMQKMADNLVEKSQHPQHTGILPPLFNTYGTRGQKLEFEERAKANQMAEINQFNKLANPLLTDNQLLVPTVDTKSLPTGTAKFDEIGGDNISLLTGLPIDKSHSNMVPFFGSTVKQRTEEFSNAPLIERYTGTEPRSGKQEISSLADKEKENIYGSPAFTTQIDIQSRYIPSTFRENELPFTQERISAPIAWGPLDKIKPQYKTIDELVVNSKETYEGRFIESSKLTGGKGDKRGVIGSVKKNRPETSFQWGEERLFKGPGAVLAPKGEADSSVTFKDQKTASVSYFGNSHKESEGNAVRLRGEGASGEELVTDTSDSKRRILEEDTSRIFRNGQWSSQLRKNPTDGIMVQFTERGNENTQILGGNKERSGQIQQLFDEAKATMKETTVFDASTGGHQRGSFTKNKMGLMDGVKPTHKEQTVENKYKSQAYRGIGEMSRKQFDKVQLKKELDADGRISGPQKFNLSASKNLVNISVKDKVGVNIRDQMPSPINIQSAHTSSIGQLSTKRQEKNVYDRTFGVANDIASQLKTNDYATRTRP
jgi:hypothetical protein